LTLKEGHKKKEKGDDDNGQKEVRKSYGAKKKKCKGGQKEKTNGGPLGRTTIIFGV